MDLAASSGVPAGTEVVLFDLDGTLLRSHGFSVDAALLAWDELRAAGELPAAAPRPRRAAIQANIGRPWHEFYAGLLPPESQDLAPRFHERVAAHELRALRAGEAELFPDAHAVLAALGERGYRLGLVSNASQPYFAVVVDVFELAPRFHHTECIGEHAPGAMSKADLIRRALDALGSRRAVMIGDTLGDVKAAEAAGLGCLIVTHGYGGAAAGARAAARLGGLIELLAVLPG